jgi:hypothetical protein
MKTGVSFKKENITAHLCEKLTSADNRFELKGSAFFLQTNIFCTTKVIFAADFYQYDIYINYTIGCY